MREPDLQALEALHAATPENWSFDERSVRVDGLLESGEIDPHIGILHVYRMKDPARRRSIGRFIVTAHNNFPALAASLRAVWAELAEARSTFEEESNRVIDVIRRLDPENRLFGFQCEVS